MTVPPAPGFSWNCSKFESNIKKHRGVRFDVAIRAFADPYGFDDARKIETDEKRFSFLALLDRSFIISSMWNGQTGPFASSRPARPIGQSTMTITPERRSKIIALLPDLPQYTAEEIARLEAMTDEETFLNALADPDGQPSDDAKQDYMARRQAELRHEKDRLALTQQCAKGL